MLQLFEDLGITDRLQWKRHAMIFARADRPGVLSRFDFPDIPGPFNGLVAIFSNTDMLSLKDKLLFGLSLLPAIVFGQKYVEEMDSVYAPAAVNVHASAHAPAAPAKPVPDNRLSRPRCSRFCYCWWWRRWRRRRRRRLRHCRRVSQLGRHVSVRADATAARSAAGWAARLRATRKTITRKPALMIVRKGRYSASKESWPPAILRLPA